MGRASTRGVPTKRDAGEQVTCCGRGTVTVVQPTSDASGHSDDFGGNNTMPTNVWEPGARLSSGPERNIARKQAGYSDAVFPVLIRFADPGKSL